MVKNKSSEKVDDYTKLKEIKRCIDGSKLIKIKIQNKEQDDCINKNRNKRKSTREICFGLNLTSIG